MDCLEIRQVLNFPPLQDEADYGLYYRGVMDSVDEMLREACSHARHQDVIQLELRGEHLRRNISDILQGDTYFRFWKTPAQTCTVQLVGELKVV